MVKFSGARVNGTYPTNGRRSPSMIKRKPMLPASPGNRKITGRGNHPNSAFTQFKPGQSGNINGRPKLLTGSMSDMLRELIPVKVEIDEKKIEVKIPRHELIARSQCEIASSVNNRNAVNAAKFILDVTEPRDDADSPKDIDRSLVREMLAVLMARKVSGRVMEA
jgi:hypothetical protein